MTELSIPQGHFGMSYFDFLSKLSVNRCVKNYLEIGISDGALLSNISAKNAVGVDPVFALNKNVVLGKKRLVLHQKTSDEFFSDDESVMDLNGAPDLVFLDGMHTFEYLLRDFYNSEALCHEGSLIIMHDCLPLNMEMAQREASHAVQIGRETKYSGYWTGDVWKIIPILKKYRPDLRLVLVDCPPTGLLCVTNLDPDSRLLKKNYMSIVDEYINVENSAAEISRMYESTSIVESARVLHDFDHSLYFSV